MKRSVMSKILLAVLALVMIVSMLPLSAMAAPVTHTINFSELEKWDPVDDPLGVCKELDAYYSVYLGKNTKVDGSKNTIGEIAFTQRLNPGGATKFEDGIPQRALMFKAEGAGSVKIWWKSGSSDGRNIALYNASGEIIEQSDAAEAVKDGKYVSEFAIPAAGTYFIGNPVNTNYIFQVEVSVEPAAPETPDVPEHGDNTAIFAMMAMMAVSAAAILVLNKKRAF